MSEYDKALKEIPERIYENVLFISVVKYLPMLLLFFSNEQILQLLKPSNPHLSATLLSAFTMIIGNIMDVKSTVKTLEINKKAISLGINTGIRETSLAAGKDPTIERFKKISIINGIIIGGLSVFSPFWGTFVGLTSGLCVLNNSRKGQRIEKAIQLKN